MRTSGFLTTFLLLFAVLLPSSGDELDAQFVRGRAYYKNEGSTPFTLKTGKIDFSSRLTIMTFFDGQCFLDSSANSQFRLKEDSLVFFETSENCEVRKGLVGIAVENDRPLKINTPHLAMEAQNATFVVKCCPVITRLCVLKGSVVLINPRFNQKTTIKAGKEIAAGSGMYSKLYDFSDELRYAWYWVEPLREPSLRP
jgi:hypothetical protein